MPMFQVNITTTESYLIEADSAAELDAMDPDDIRNDGTAETNDYSTEVEIYEVDENGDEVEPAEEDHNDKRTDSPATA